MGVVIPHLSLVLSGLAVGMSLIVAIGAQNAFVLRQGVRREHVATVVGICMVSDAVLIVAGTAGVGALVTHLPWALTALTWGGVGYLAWFGARSLRSAFTSHALVQSSPTTVKSVAATTMALTFLNPHVYLDTVVMLGSLANQQGSPGRWWFAGGAALGSVLWFAALGFGARALAGPLGRPAAWRVIDILIAAVMFAIALKLALGGLAT